MRAFVAERLRRGQLEATGFRTKPETGDAQEIIPPFYFDHAKINWERNVVEKFGVRFEAVEVRKPDKAKEAVCEQAPKSPPALEPEDIEQPKKRGPRSKKLEIMKAIAVLDRQGFDLRGPNKPYYEAILKQLGRSSGDDGYSDAVLFNCLKKYLSPRMLP